MVTRNFLNLLAMSLQQGSDAGGLPVRAADGQFRYLNGGLIGSISKTVTTNAAGAGISVGSGNTAPTEDDWNLKDTFTSGVTLTLSETVYGNDGPGYPYVQYKVTVTNTGSDPITVKEIGYKQSAGTSRYPGLNVGSSSDVLLLERTVLDTPVTIAAGDAGIVTYKLRTIPKAYETVSGVQITSFADGTDEQIAAILDAAIAGDVDLRQDAGWRVGDKRIIHVGAFTGGNGVTNPAEDVCIAISSFDEYNGCGNVLQFDFACCLTTDFRMNTTNTTSGGYGAMEMYTTTLPALVEALPSWLRTRLKTFSVLASAGGSSISTIETVTGNKLALRASVEIFGEDGNGQPGEGVQVEYYKTPIAGNVKTHGLNGALSVWMTRSAKNSTQFCDVTTSGTYDVKTAGVSAGVAPFGCI